MENWHFYVFWAAFTLPVLFVEMVLARHAMRSGRPAWAVAILMLPVFAGFIYWVSEYLPALRARRLELAQEEEPVPLP